MVEDVLKQKVQGQILLVSTLILIGKFTAYWLTGSVGILTDAMESIVNVAAGAFSLYSLHWAAHPKDTKHPYGYGKIELISSSVEGMMIVIAGILIIYEGIEHLINPVTIQKLDIGIYIVAFSGLLNYIMGWYSVRIGRKYNSIALESGGKHLQSDTYSTIGLVLGLILLNVTKIGWIDSLLAFLFGGIIVVTGISILRKTISNLLDKADETLLKELANYLNNNRQPDWIDIHNTRVLKYGSCLHVDCDLTLPWFYTVDKGHECGAYMKELLQQKYGERIDMTIHLDPCNVSEECKCGYCANAECSYRQKPFDALVPISFQTFTQTDNEKADNS